MSAEDREDMLHIGATRPAMFWGLPIVLAVGILVMGYEIQAAFGNLKGIAWAIAVCGPVWIVARWLVGRDIYGINVLAAALRLRGLTSSSRSPLPAIQSARAYGMRYVR